MNQNPRIWGQEYYAVIMACALLAADLGLKSLASHMAYPTLPQACILPQNSIPNLHIIF